MLTSFSVENYRGLNRLTIDGLRRVNLIAGENNVGKTSLLEALYLAHRFYDMEAMPNIAKWRGIQAGPGDLKEVGRLLFGDMDGGSPIVFEEFNDEGIRSTTRISISTVEGLRGDRPELFGKLFGAAAEPWSSDRPTVSVEYRDTSGQTTHSVFVSVFDAVMKGWSETPRNVLPIQFVSAGAWNEASEIEAFSQATVDGSLETQVAPTLRHIEPRLKRLTLAKLAGQDMLFADVGRTRLIPFASMGEGIRRALAFSLAIARSHGGIVLIDEIENGLHYSAIENIWRAIGESAKLANCQVFATTHSYECIQAAQKAFADNGEEDLAFIRLEREGDIVSPIVVDEDALETAIGHQWEMR